MIGVSPLHHRRHGCEVRGRACAASALRPASARILRTRKRSSRLSRMALRAILELCGHRVLLRHAHRATTLSTHRGRLLYSEHSRTHARGRLLRALTHARTGSLKSTQFAESARTSNSSDAKLRYLCRTNGRACVSRNDATFPVATTLRVTACWANHECVRRSRMTPRSMGAGTT